MVHLDFSPTPISKLDYYSRKFECNILCKRDDLFTEAGGGSKARMLQYILAEIIRASYLRRTELTEYICRSVIPCASKRILTQKIPE